MDSAPRKIQWLKRIMKDLGDDQECAMPNKQKVAERSATHPTSCQGEDDSDLDRLLRRAVLLLRMKATNAQRDIVLFGEDGEAPVEATDGEEQDKELDELLQRATLLLRQRLARQRPQEDNVTALATSQREEEDEELDKLLRRAMLLFSERRKVSNGEDNIEIDGEVDIVRLKMIDVVKGSASPGSPGMTDG
ncbi:hypothetical protein F442_07289 [Phytophthora nicotianae P10297]|uniref:Uncharacterized protein n=1 Tax=Phytophthora nicotianae P10297 TaxID=1317064 RepID=W2ZJU6_PHYNI|nr:hypothetical protein F442_07289 [Phytophthora nicotianae P10297]